MFHIIDNIVSNIQDILNVLYKPYQLIMSKRFNLESLSRQVCSMLNKLTDSDAFSPDDYIYCFMFDKFWLLNKDSKQVLVSGSFNWKGIYLDSIDAKNSIHTKEVLEISESEMSVRTRIEGKIRNGKVYEYVFRYNFKPSDKVMKPNCEVINGTDNDLVYTEVILRCDAELNNLSFSKNYYSFFDDEDPEIGSVMIKSIDISSVPNEMFRLYLEYLSSPRDVTFLFPEMDDDSVVTDIKNDDLLQRVSLAKMMLI